MGCAVKSKEEAEVSVTEVSPSLPRSVPDCDQGWPCVSGQHGDCVGVADNAIEGVFAECPCLCHRRSVLTGGTTAFGFDG